MSAYFIYYTEASLVCVIIFGVMLSRDLISVDRQEKQIKYDRTLVAFMLYFVSDALWAAVIAGVLPRNRFTVLTTNFANTVLMSAITYTWLGFVMAIEQAPHRERRINQFAVAFPFMVSAIAMVILYLVSPQVLVSDALELQPAYNAFLIVVPCIYITAVLISAIRRARTEDNLIERRRHLVIGFFPLMVIVGGLVQVLLLPQTPIFCFCCTILMLIFYINSMESRISTDPLTMLNNRGQLLRYSSQKANLYREGRRTFVVMFDINDFKGINDTYGHAEGDRALLLVAQSLRQVMRRHNMPAFLGRYGGDEFILVLHPAEADGPEPLIAEIRGEIESRCRAEGLPYVLSLGAGCDMLKGEGDTFQKCLQRADEKLYLDKAAMKERAALRR